MNIYDIDSDSAALAHAGLEINVNHFWSSGSPLGYSTTPSHTEIDSADTAPSHSWTGNEMPTHYCAIETEITGAAESRVAAAVCKSSALHHAREMQNWRVPKCHCRCGGRKANSESSSSVRWSYFSTFLFSVVLAVLVDFDDDDDYDKKKRYWH